MTTVVAAQEGGGGGSGRRQWDNRRGRGGKSRGARRVTPTAATAAATLAALPRLTSLRITGPVEKAAKDPPFDLEAFIAGGLVRGGAVVYGPHRRRGWWRRWAPA